MTILLKSFNLLLYGFPHSLLAAVGATVYRSLSLKGEVAVFAMIIWHSQALLVPPHFIILPRNLQRYSFISTNHLPPSSLQTRFPAFYPNRVALGNFAGCPGFTADNLQNFLNVVNWVSRKDNSPGTGTAIYTMGGKHFHILFSSGWLSHSYAHFPFSLSANFVFSRSEIPA